MIKVEVFDGTDSPITIIGEGTIDDFLDWSRGSKIVGIVEKDTGALFTIPILRYPIKITDLLEEKTEDHCMCDECAKALNEDHDEMSDE